MELDRSSVIDRLQSRIMSIDDFNFDRLSAPPLYSLLSQQDIDKLYSVAHSIRYSGNPAKKYKMIDSVLKPRGFTKLSAGTNRVVYKHVEFDNIVLKVAYDDIGLKDNPKEFMNQHIFKPFVTKIFEVSPCGTVAVVERVIPITSREEFHSVAEDVYLAINNWFIGKYIMADIGTKFFMNWGIRRGFGVVLIDFPYCYELDGNKLYCSALNNNNPNGICDGLIDYDDGFNFLVCEKCGTKYRVNELGKSINNKNIIIKGRRKNKMKVSTVRHGVKVTAAEDSLGLKPETASVVVQEKKSSTSVGSLKVSTKYVEVERKKRKNNVSVKMGSGKQQKINNNNRGGVRSDKQPTSNIKVSDMRKANVHATEDVKVLKETPKADITVVGYDEEKKVINIKLIYGDDTVETSIEVDSIPEEYINAIIEASEIRTELSQALIDLNSAESENIEYKKRVKKLSEELEKHLDTISSLKANNEELEKKVIFLEDKVDDTLVDKLRKEITDLQSKIKSIYAEQEEASTETPDPEHVSLLEEKNQEIEMLREENIRLSDSIGELSEQIANTSQESYHYEKEISRLKEEIKTLTDTVDDKDAKISALEGLLYEANEKIESFNPKVQLSNFSWSKENDVYALFEKLEIGASFIQGKIVPITSLVHDDTVIPDNIKDEHIIIFPTGDDDLPNFVDQDNNIIAAISINGSLIGEIMTPPEPVEMVEAPIGATQK